MINVSKWNAILTISNVLKVISEAIFLDDQIHSLSYMKSDVFLLSTLHLSYNQKKSLLHDFSNTPHWVLSILKDSNWHIQWNENLALELSYDLGLGCSPLFSNSTDYDSSYPWIRLRFVHLMGVRPVQTYCWKTNVSISLPSPTSDNAINMSIGYLPQKKYTKLNLF